MPSIINRVGVVPDFGEETGGELPETGEKTPVETKSVETKSADPKTVKQKTAKSDKAATKR